MKKGMTFPTPLPTQIVSMRSFPDGQTAKQARVEQVTGELVAKAASRQESHAGSL